MNGSNTPPRPTVAGGNEPATIQTPLVVLAGASGLVGASCADQLVKRGFATVALVRRPLESSPAGLNSVTVDFGHLSERKPTDLLSAAGLGDRPVTAALCALGTTIKKAGSQAAFRAVDHDAVIAFATWARAAGATRFVVVSSVGADAGASNFYLRVKGEMEAGLRALGFSRLVILRPSFLKGDRQERRLGESIAGVLFPVVQPLLAGSLRRYRSIDATTVARAMVAAATTDAPPDAVWEHDEIVRAANTLTDSESTAVPGPTAGRRSGRRA